MPRLFLSLALALSLVSVPVAAQPPGAEPPAVAGAGPMTPDRLLAILLRLDPEAGPRAGGIGLTISDVPVIVFMDPTANRMRAVVPVASAEGLGEDDMRRVLQANFDTALDARYALAKDVLWSAFIHPLTPLEKDQLISGLGQVVNLAQSYGTLYSGGALQYGGGDSGALQRALIDDLLKKGEEI